MEKNEVSIKFDILYMVIYRTIEKYFNTIKEIYPELNKVYREGSYGFAQSRVGYINRLLELINSNKLSKNIKIADYGCGISPVLTILHCLNYKNLYGIEYENVLIKGMNTLINSLLPTEYCPNDIRPVPPTIYNRNLIEDDYSSITKEMDIIYMYQPINDSKLYKKMILNIWEDMKPGAFIMDFYGPIHEIKNIQKYRIEDTYKYWNIYQKPVK